MEDSGLLPTREVKKVKGITGIRVASPSGEGAPYAIWIWGAFPDPIGKVKGFLLSVWDGDPPVFTEGSYSSFDGNRRHISIFPDFRKHVCDTLTPYWKGIKKTADSADLNPESGHLKPVTIPMIELKEFSS